MDPIITTLGAMAITRGLAYVISDSQSILMFEETTDFISNGVIFNVPIPILLFILTALIFSIVLHKSKFGRSIYAIGANEVSASLSGISVNKTKMISEHVFLSFKDKIDVTCLRPATVCGVSKRLRLDITVNKLTFDAFYKNKIFVDGGSQIRPNIHISDIMRLIEHCVSNTKRFKHNIYNIGFENLSILQIAEKIKNKTGAEIVLNKNKDIRSYRQDSSRIIKTGFKPKYNVDYAIDELINYFSLKKESQFGDINFNLKKMKSIHVK